MPRAGLAGLARQPLSTMRTAPRIGTHGVGPGGDKQECSARASAVDNARPRGEPGDRLVSAARQSPGNPQALSPRACSSLHHRRRARAGKTAPARQRQTRKAQDLDGQERLWLDGKGWSRRLYALGRVAEAPSRSGRTSSSITALKAAATCWRSSAARLGPNEGALSIGSLEL